MARRSYTRRGLNALMTRISLKGLTAIDRRTTAARAVLDFRREVLDDLRGEPAVSAAELARPVHGFPPGHPRRLKF